MAEYIESNDALTKQEDKEANRLLLDKECFRKQNITQHITVDEVFGKAGGMGIYQWRLFVLALVIGVMSVEAVSINFVAGHQDHWCHIKELEMFSHTQQKSIAIPQDSDGAYHRCLMFDLNYTSFTLGDLVNWNRSRQNTSISTLGCKSWVYDKSVFVETIISRYDLVCGRQWMASFTSTLFMGGVLVGGIVGGYCSDRFGRKKTIYGCLMVKVVSNIFGLLPLNFPVLAIARFFMGAASISTYCTTFVLVIELTCGLWRTITGVGISAAFSIGFMMWAGLAHAIRDDVKLQLTVTIPMSLVLAYWWLLDESPHWLLKKQRHEEATEVFKKISTVNIGHLDDDFDSRDIIMLDQEQSNASWRQFLRSQRMRLRALIIALYWFTVSLMYYALSLNTGALSGDIFTNTLIIGAVEIPANLLCVLCLAWRVTGRRITCSVSLVTAGAASYISVYMIIKDIGVAHTIFATVSKMFVSLAFSAIYIYSSELFPTEVRNIAIGIASMCARVSGMAAPYVGGPLGDIWKPLPPIVYGTFAVVSGFLALLLPETRGAALPKTLKEAEQLGRSPIVVHVDVKGNLDEMIPLQRL